MALAIGMQMSLVLLGLSSGLQLGRHRYARKVNQLPGMGREEGGGVAGGGGCGVGGQFGNPPDWGPHSKINNSQVHLRLKKQTKIKPKQDLIPTN